MNLESIFGRSDNLGHRDRDGDIPASGSRRPRLPAINISWDDAQRYVAWLSKITGKPYRLLSEAEWEYAARARTVTRFSFGEDEAELDQYAWYSGNSSNRAHPVGQKTPNTFGAFDMHGNDWEWVEDCYHDDYEGAPVDGSAWTTGDCGARVVRGGSWGSGPQYLRATNRLRNTPNRFDYLGFRVGPNPRAATFRSGIRAADDGNPVRTRPAVPRRAMGRLKQFRVSYWRDADDFVPCNKPSSNLRYTGPAANVVGMAAVDQHRSYTWPQLDRNSGARAIAW